MAAVESVVLCLCELAEHRMLWQRTLALIKRYRFFEVSQSFLHIEFLIWPENRFELTWKFESRLGRFIFDQYWLHDWNHQSHEKWGGRYFQSAGGHIVCSRQVLKNLAKRMFPRRSNLTARQSFGICNDIIHVIKSQISSFWSSFHRKIP
jgi:hypothetical protein